jgi:hypothetical protein
MLIARFKEITANISKLDIKENPDRNASHT